MIDKVGSFPPLFLQQLNIHEQIIFPNTFVKQQIAFHIFMP